MSTPADEIAEAARDVLRANDTGTLIKAAPHLYPHQWSWDAAFVSIGLATSGICQPAVHGIALRRIRQRAAGCQHERTVLEYLNRTFDSWLGWHRWLHDVRAADGSGLLTIHHGWESGMDNSPRVDAAYERVEPGELAPFVRTDTSEIADLSQRPSELECGPLPLVAGFQPAVLDGRRGAGIGGRGARRLAGHSQGSRVTMA